MVGFLILSLLLLGPAGALSDFDKDQITGTVRTQVTEARVLILGDSLSAAYNMAIDEGWVDLMQQRANQRRCRAEIINASISGETTAGALTRLPALLERHHPSIVMVELGGNDALRGLSLAAFESNLSQIIEQVLATQSRIVLAEILIPSNYGQRYRSQFQAVYQRLAAGAEVQLLPFLLRDVALDPTLMQADGIHPNEQAQPIILEAVWPTLLPALQCPD